MGFPAKLKNMNLYLDGIGHSGIVQEVTLPKLALKMAEWRGGGMLGPLQVDQGLEKMELEATVGGLIAGMLRQFGIGSFDGVHARFAGAFQEEGGGAVRVLEVNVLGRWTTIDLGQQKVGDDTQHKGTFAVAYYELNVDGENWLTIDFLSMVFLVFGVDRYEEIRNAVSD
ncbi:phage major tail tube protein [Novosphingobium sp.]|uniref:phage major tail tube protein n=1 Tax=Novosphingobium sp. TaxID=1874826 RepID=UPI0031D69927